MEKMRGFYKTLGIDIFEDAVSLPGVSMNYLLCGTLNRPNAPELFAPWPEAYEMLKSAVVGGPSLVFCRKHEAGVTSICSHKHQDAKVYALYPSTMLGWMPCGKKEVQNWLQTEECLRNFIDAVKKRKDGSGLLMWTLRCRGNHGRSSKKCLRCFTTDQFQAKQCRSI